MKLINALRHKGQGAFEEKAKLQLTTRVLRETEDREVVRMFVKLTDIRTAVKRENKLVDGYWVDDPLDLPVALVFDTNLRSIGCCSFSKTAFNTILKAAKAAK